MGMRLGEMRKVKEWEWEQREWEKKRGVSKNKGNMDGNEYIVWLEGMGIKNRKGKCEI